MSLRGIFLLGSLLAGACSPETGSEPPVLGDWTLDLGRTVYGFAVERRVDERFACSMAGQVVHCRIFSTREGGKTVATSFEAVPDGPAGEVQGVEGLNKVRLASVRPGLLEATFYDNDHPRFACRARRDADGRSLIIVTIDPITRATLSTTVVYRRSSLR